MNFLFESLKKGDSVAIGYFGKRVYYVVKILNDGSVLTATEKGRQRTIKKSEAIKLILMGRGA